MEFARRVGFLATHVFKYSKRAGTPAAKMPGQIPEDVKHARSQALIALSEESTARRLGIDPNIANSLYARYGRTMQAKALCGLLGTTPEALRSDANKILGGAQNASQPPQKGKAGQSSKFPRLK